MSWVRIDDKAWCHPKFAGLSGNAVRLWLYALCWCNAQQADGHVPKSMIRTFGSSAKDVEALIMAGLWEATDDGWVFHNYLRYQPSKAKIEAKREQISNRVTLHRKRSRNIVTLEAGAEPVTQVYASPQSQSQSQDQRDPPVVPQPGDANEAPTKPARAKRRSALPAAWEPTPAHAAKASELRIPIDPQAEKFRAHALATGRLMADWNAAFTTWLLKAADWARPTYPPKSAASQQESIFERAQRLTAEYEEQQEKECEKARSVTTGCSVIGSIPTASNER